MHRNGTLLNGDPISLMPAESVPPPGFHGKLPARGDFLIRRVPAGIAHTWEEWLEVLVVHVRNTAPGETGREAWLTAPLWHFVLGLELAPAHGAAGLLAASADRIGRLFPFTIIGAARPPLARDETNLADWFQHTEDLVFDALEETIDPDAFDAALIRLGPPPLADGPEQAAGQRLLQQPDPKSGEADAPARDALAERPGPRQSLWWCRGTERVPAVLLRCDGLPDAPLAAAMILGGLEIGRRLNRDREPKSPRIPAPDSRGPRR